MKSSKFCKLLMGLAFTFMALVTLVLFLNRQQASEMVAVPFTNEGNVRLDISKAPEATEAEEQPADVLPRPEALSSRAITSSDVRPAEFRQGRRI